MPLIPKDTHLDSTSALLKEGYVFIANRREAYKSDIFEARFMLQKVICLGGTEAAAVFYDNAHFIRKNTLPLHAQEVSAKKHLVQSPETAAHHQRDALLMSLLGKESRQKLMGRIDTHWQQYFHDWQQKGRIVLWEEMQEMLFRAACDWAGISYQASDVIPCARDLGTMIEGSGGIGSRYWRGLMARRRMEHWAQRHISHARDTQQTDNPTSPLQLLAHYRDSNGTCLEADEAARELLTILNPVMAIATYATFIAHALHTHPECRQKLQQLPHYVALFVQEVRRFYPFIPFVGARVRKLFKWNGYYFPTGRLVMLDVYGMNHDPRYWYKPERFLPERFNNRQDDPYTFIPQGVVHHHAEEGAIVDALTLLAQYFASMSYTIPSQNLSIDLSRIPTHPVSGVIMEDIVYAPTQPLQRVA